MFQLDRRNRLEKKIEEKEPERRVDIVKLNNKVEEIYNALVGTFKDKGLIIKVKELDKSNKNIIRLFSANCFAVLALVVTLIIRR